MKPQVTKRGLLDMQVCVPNDHLWDNDEIKRFADAENPCGTENGWQIRKKGNELLDGVPERVPCAERKDFVHIMLDA